MPTNSAAPAIDEKYLSSIPLRDDEGTEGIRVLAAAVAAMLGYWIIPGEGGVGNAEAGRPLDPEP